MNKLKARTADGKAVLLPISQTKDPIWTDHRGNVYGGDWERSPAAVKARALHMGLTLTGKRQG